MNFKQIKNKQLGLFWVLALTFMSLNLNAQQIPSDKVLSLQELVEVLKPEVKTRLNANAAISEAALSNYFRQKFSERFFYDHKTFANRLTLYNDLYQNQANHENRALDHLSKYADSTQWVLPFNYLNDEPVDAYALRHLARQHKMVDIALFYFNNGKDPKYIKYFTKQMYSLNVALKAGQYEKIEDGNGVYEVFRSGYRIFNWLWIHNMLLNEKEYSDSDQLQTIATLLQHGQHLYERNGRFRSGNHQTKGMAALAALSILFRDFAGTEQWYERAMLRLEEHLDEEINPDGFQFERSVHYHMSDINNYFYAYQLAKISKIDINQSWEEKLRILFTSLVKIAYPDKSAPVLQDDTEIPWAEKNDISGAMTLGYLLFEDPEFGYFASDKVDDRMYWFLSNTQVDLLNQIQRKKPEYGSLAFHDTHYYIMREGWNTNDKMMIISAGLDAKKPDHQHGDMLGVQAISHGHVILPNYQVRYSLKDFDFFKNSMVKNVALVDDQLQGKQWTSNKGGSGFGKFKSLPHPEVLAWQSKEDFDLFIGKHDGFENIGVDYSRQVIFVKDDFWIVKDNFSSGEKHDYKQVWQGHYTHELGPNMLRASFPDVSGVDLLQLNPIDSSFSSGKRGKSWSVALKAKQKDFSFITVIFPYRGYNNRIDELAAQVSLKAWEVNDAKWEIKGNNPVSISKNNEVYAFKVQELQNDGWKLSASSAADFYLNKVGDKLQIHLLGIQNTTFRVSYGNGENKREWNKELQPGEHFELK